MIGGKFIAKSTESISEYNAKKSSENFIRSKNRKKNENILLSCDVNDMLLQIKIRLNN